jgi:hypothetical protein
VSLSEVERIIFGKVDRNIVLDASVGLRADAHLARFAARRFLFEVNSSRIVPVDVVAFGAGRLYAPCT